MVISSYKNDGHPIRMKLIVDCEAWTNDLSSCSLFLIADGKKMVNKQISHLLVLLSLVRFLLTSYIIIQIWKCIWLSTSQKWQETESPKTFKWKEVWLLAKVNCWKWKPREGAVILLSRAQSDFWTCLTL